MIVGLRKADAFVTYYPNAVGFGDGQVARAANGAFVWRNAKPNDLTWTYKLITPNSDTTRP
jgi:hypothetical protein